MYIVGIDEVGRGPLAGPVAVGAVMVSEDFDWNQIPGIRDSKKLTEKAREKIAALAEGLEKMGAIKTSVHFSSAKVIDDYGIVPAIRAALENTLISLKTPLSARILLDGGLKAPEKFSNQTSIIKGDSKELSIALASIVAKVRRDRLMNELSEKYPGYGLEKHKGYGTAAHIQSIQRYGASEIHRKSFLTKIADS